MADTKITGLTEDTTPASTDLLITVDDPGGSPVNKKATIANVTRLKIDKAISATDKIIGRATAGAGDAEEIPCTAAGRAIIGGANAAAQIATLGLDADIATLALPANTTISAAGAELVNDANAAAQIATLGAVATGDSRLSDARPASDVSAWAKAGTKPAYTAAEVGVKNIATGNSVTHDVNTNNTPLVTAHGMGGVPVLVFAFTGGTSAFLTVSAITSTTFTIRPTTGELPFNWIAVA